SRQDPSSRTTVFGACPLIPRRTSWVRGADCSPTGGVFVACRPARMDAAKTLPRGSGEVPQAAVCSGKRRLVANFVLPSEKPRKTTQASVIPQLFVRHLSRVRLPSPPPQFP